MFELTQIQKADKAIERARQIHPRVRVVKFGEYLVTNSTKQYAYTVRCVRTPQGRRLLECTCLASENGRICFHLAAGAAVHVGIARMRAPQTYPAFAADGSVRRVTIPTD
jgi:hypothetical protein